MVTSFWLTSAARYIPFQFPNLPMSLAPACTLPRVAATSVVQSCQNPHVLALSLPNAGYVYWAPRLIGSDDLPQGQRGECVYSVRSVTSLCSRLISCAAPLGPETAEPWTREKRSRATCNSVPYTCPIITSQHPTASGWERECAFGNSRPKGRDCFR
ncbi:hypothetical protein F4776DRAFT_283974 [Hypoxylon sp. NC0597]|nr:hypothetical protein F4776DRAFT_283974 [Hypoxylon sp. NC0597]